MFTAGGKSYSPWNSFRAFTSAKIKFLTQDVPAETPRERYYYARSTCKLPNYLPFCRFSYSFFFPLLLLLLLFPWSFARLLFSRNLLSTKTRRVNFRLEIICFPFFFFFFRKWFSYNMTLRSRHANLELL